MLSGFQKYAVRIHIILRATLESFSYFCLDWLADIITRTAPFQTSIGCRFRPSNYNAIAALCGCTEPLAIWRNPLSPLGYKQKFFQASSGQSTNVHYGPAATSISCFNTFFNYHTEETLWQPLNLRKF